jgi:hypothetical protein
VLAQFPVIAVDTVMRRTLRSCIIVAVIAVVMTVWFGQWEAAPGIVIGFAAGLGNQRILLASNARFISTEGKVSRKPFAGTVALRLGAITAIAFGLLFVLRPAGWGMLGALLAFQIILILNSMVALVHYLRHQPPAGATSPATALSGSLEHEVR